MNCAPAKAVVSELTPINVGGKESKRLMIVLRTRGCSYARKSGGCKHCALIQNSNPAITTSDLKEQLESELNKYKNQEFQLLDLLTLGSFFDENEIPGEFFTYALNRISGIESLKRVLLESRPEFVTREKVRKALKLLGDKELEVGVGLESSNEFVRGALLNKGFTLNDVEKTVKILAEFGVGFLSYVLVKPVGLTEKEAIDDSIKAINYAFALGEKYGVPTRVALEPFYIPRNSPAEIKYKIGEYKPPKLWSITEVIRKTRQLGPMFVALNDEGLSDGLTASNCKLCDLDFLTALHKFNATNDFHCLDDLDCPCRKGWQKSTGGRK